MSKKIGYKGIFRRLQGVRKDPLCCLGAISAFLFGILVFTASSSQGGLYISDKTSRPKAEARLLPAYLIEKNPGQDPLFESADAQIEPPDLSLVQKNSLIAASSPLFVNPQVFGQIIGGSKNGAGLREEVAEYLVQLGDTLLSIAESFGISLDTLLWANNLNKNSVIKPGQKLVILPLSGVIHHVKKGDTINDIAKIYKGKLAEIITFNELSPEGDIYIGDILIIPDGIMPPPPKPQTPNLVPLASSFFICPISSPCRISQGLHWYNAIDLTHGKCGESILAAAGGEILRVKYGWNNGAGNYLTILHPNGVVTMYGHLQSVLVNPGDNVSQGQIIALMGGQPGAPGAGKSTGCHLHFGVQGARNPLAK